MRAPMSLIRTVPNPAPIMPHPTHAEQRPREHLTPAEVDRLMQAAQRRGRYGHRDATLILVMAQHGFRVGEVTRLVWQAIDFTDATIQIRRLKHGRDTLQPLNGQELRALRKLKREWPETVYVFTSERGAPLSTEAVRKIVLRAGEAAKFPFPLHPHMLRHACGYRLVNAGVDTRMIQEVLGHRNIRHTEGYTALHATRFREVLGK